MADTITLKGIALRRVSDADALTRAARGDATAFAEVYRRFNKRIYGYCLARTLDPDAAADATQEVFMRVLRTSPDGVQQPTSYLFQTARNVLVDMARKRARTPEDGGLEVDSPAWDRLRASDTADEVMTRSEARDVFLALRTLRPSYRAAIIMRDLHGESAADMATALESTSGAVDTLVSRARDAFGIAYAAVRDLPQDCRAATELMYRALGSGIAPEEQIALDAHVLKCERCCAEMSRAHDPRRLSALLPFLLPAKRTAGTLLQRAALAMRGAPEAVAPQVASVVAQPHSWDLAMKMGAGALAIALVAAPVALGPLRHWAAVASRGAASGATWPVMQAYQHDHARAGHMQGGVCTDEFWSEQRAGHTWSAANDAYCSSRDASADVSKHSTWQSHDGSRTRASSHDSTRHDGGSTSGSSSESWTSRSSDGSRSGATGGDSDSGWTHTSSSSYGGMGGE